MHTQTLIGLIIVIFTLGIPSVKGQGCSGGDFANAYLAVLANKEINSKIKAVFPELTRTKQKINIRIDSQIEYIPIYISFKDNGKELLTIIDSLTKRSPDMTMTVFDASNRFESYSIEYLKELSLSPSAQLTLRFSTCGPNYILAEILDGRLNYGRTRFGKVLHLLFILDEQGFVKNIYCSSYAYN